MADYVVEFTGRNNLSQAAQGVKKDLEAINNEAGKVSQNVSKYDAFAARFEKISNSTKPLKAQLGSLKRLLADMNMEGFNDHGLMTEVAMKAGQIEDSINDARDAIHRFSSDTHNLDATIQAFELGAAGTSVLTGAMGMLGVESEKTTKMILKVQSALAVLNGVQQIANILNKDSALMQKLKAIRLEATTKAEAKNTIAIAANTVAEKANTTATAASTVAQNGWNTAKAIAKALLGDFTGLILLGVGALSTYAMFTSDAADEQAQLNDEVDEAAEKQKRYKDVMSDTFASLMSDYTKMKNEWKSLKSEHDKNQWLVDNKNKLVDLGIAVENVVDAENAFNGNTNAVVDNFIKRAKAAARLAELTDLYREQMELLDKRETTLKGVNSSTMKQRTGKTAQEGQAIPSGYYDSRYGKVDQSGTWRFTKEGAAMWNNGAGENAASVKKIDDALAENSSKIEKLTTEIGKDTNVTLKPKSTTSTTPTKSTTATNAKTDVQFAKGSLADLEAQLSAAKKRLTTGMFQGNETQESLTQLVQDLEAKVKEKKIELKFDVSEAQNKLEEANKQFSKVKTQYTPKTSSFDEATGNNNQRLDAIKDEMDFNDELIQQLMDLLALYDSLGNVEGIKAVNEQLGVTLKKQTELAGQAKTLNGQIEDKEKESKAWGYYAQMLSSTADAFSILGDSEEAAAAKFALGTGVILADAVKTITAMNAEALAKGASSAFDLPFPANLAAWATVLTTITSIFAALPKFAEGGIVGGSMYEHPIMAHKGEVILNERQQKTLFDAIDKGNMGGSGSIARVVGRVRGKDLELVLDNNKRSKSRAGINLTF